ncbi:MAG: hypothetical protein ACPIOQ_60130 [Promethearchaeia archaeon]
MEPSMDEEEGSFLASRISAFLGQMWHLAQLEPIMYAEYRQLRRATVCMQDDVLCDIDELIL